MHHMGRRDTGLLGEIELQVLDSSVPIADVLRKCVILGGRAGSAALRDWASRELKGYREDTDDLPAYRRITAPLAWNGLAGNFQVTGQPLGAEVIPEFAREAINNTLLMVQGIGEIEVMIANAEGGDVKLQPSGADIVANYLN